VTTSSDEEADDGFMDDDDDEVRCQRWDRDLSDIYIDMQLVLITSSKEIHPHN